VSFAQELGWSIMKGRSQRVIFPAGVSTLSMPQYLTRSGNRNSIQPVMKPALNIRKRSVSGKPANFE